MSQDWVKLLTSSNTKPFIKKDNKYKSDFFVFKFTSSFMKLMELKGLKLKLATSEKETVLGAEISNFGVRNLILPFSYGDKMSLGWVNISAPLVEICLHRMLGGSPIQSIDSSERPLSSIEKTTLKQIHAPLEVSLREGLKGLLGIDNASLGNPWERLDLEKELSQMKSYFCETFYFEEGNYSAPLQVFMRVDLF